MRRRNSIIGTEVERIEDMRFLRGRGEYVGDLERPGLLHAAILRSSIPHGRIRSINPSPALRLTGVRAVVTAADIDRRITIPLRQDKVPGLERFVQPVIAADKVRYVGEPIAVIVAETAAIAEDALEAVEVDIEPLAAVANRDASQAGDILLFEEAGTNVAAQMMALLGDAGATFETAPYVRRERFGVHRYTGVPMEARGLIAEWDINGHLTIFGASKVPFPNRRTLAGQLGIPETSIRMVENDVGGGFGVRGEFYPEDFIIPFVARHVGRPVKWIEDRREHLVSTNHARDAECDLEIACERDGTILGLRGHARTDIGAYARTVGATPSRNIAQVISGPYRIPNVRIDVTLLLTNKTPVATYRGPGRFEADFFRERFVDIAAQELGLDPVEFRRRNLIRESDMPYRLPTVMPLKLESQCDSGDYGMTLDRCLAEFAWREKSALQGKLIDGRYHGMAIGCYIEGGASGPKENARLTLHPDGTISVFVGSSAVGQGLETVFAQITADAMQVPLNRIRGVYHGSTDYVSEGFGSYSSRSVVMGGSAIVDAAAELREALHTAAGGRLSGAAGDLEIIDEKLWAPDGRTLLIADIFPNGLTVEGTFASHKRTYSYGTHAAHVSVDPDIGDVQVLDYVAVEDVGRIINPATLHGQAIGAIVQGLGGTLLEHLIYDEDAQLMTGSLADYLLPTASDFPRIEAVTLELKPSPNNPLGAKGAGEGGIIPVGGVIANAVAAALRSLQVQPKELPLSPPRVWRMIQDLSGSKPGG
jgi:aerobic carbon-monoxide dehydrogenase large subunit